MGRARTRSQIRGGGAGQPSAFEASAGGPSDAGLPEKASGASVKWTDLTPLPAEEPVDGALGREVLGEVGPLATRPQYVQDRIEDPTPAGGRSPGLLGFWEKRLKGLPLLVGEIALVGRFLHRPDSRCRGEMANSSKRRSQRKGADLLGSLHRFGRDHFPSLARSSFRTGSKARCSTACSSWRNAHCSSSQRPSAPRCQCNSASTPRGYALDSRDALARCS